MVRLLTAACILAALGACSKTPQAAGDPPRSEAQASASVQTQGQGSASASASASAGGALKVSEKNDVYGFDYSFPAAAGNIPDLRALLVKRMDTAKKEHVANAIDGRADADKNHYPFNPYEYTTSWEVVADLPDWLSLSAQHWEFTGGAHGNSTFDALLWDKRANTMREPLSLFVSAKALEEAVQNDLCAMLDKQRADKRGAPVKRDQSDWMNACIGLDSTTVILGSSNRRTFDRIGFLIPPYNAGPYAEGSYEVTLPVTQAVLATVKPEFRGAFSAVK